MNNPKFQVFQSTANSQYYFRLKAANGEIILKSEGYVAKASCTNGIASVKVNAPIDARYERKENNGKFSFNLKATNGEIIGTSESYTSMSSRENGIDSVKRNAPIAPIEEV
jgi:uncharacterized protein